MWYIFDTKTNKRVTGYFKYKDISREYAKLERNEPGRYKLMEKRNSY